MPNVDKPQLLHENVWFDSHSGGAHAIVHEGDEHVYFRFGKHGPGITCDVGGELSVADMEKLIGLLRAATDLVKGEIAKKAFPQQCPGGCGSPETACMCDEGR